MGICFSENSEHHKKKNLNNNQTQKHKSSFQTKQNQNNFSDSTKASNAGKKEEYILPSSLANHDNINNYYSISSEVLGKGASGEVCEAEDSSGKKYAIKRINKSSIKSKQAIIKEAEYNKKIQHEHIIQCHNIFEDKDTISFVLDLAEGGDLFDLIVNSPKQHLPLYIAIILLEQILETVSYLHNIVGVVHRDIKPENLMVVIHKDNMPEIKVIDFGLSADIPKKDVPSTYLKDFVGTPSYAAPEIINRSPYDEKVDIWSLGVLMYNMLTGLEPFAAKYTSQLHEQIILKRITFEKINDEVMREFCKKFLERNPDKRIDAQTALEEIRQIKYDLEEQFKIFESEISEHASEEDVKSQTATHENNNNDGNAHIKTESPRRANRKIQGSQADKVRDEFDYFKEFVNSVKGGFGIC